MLLIHILGKSYMRWSWLQKRVFAADTGHELDGAFSGEPGQRAEAEAKCSQAHTGKHETCWSILLVHTKLGPFSVKIMQRGVQKLLNDFPLWIFPEAHKLQPQFIAESTKICTKFSISDTTDCTWLSVHHMHNQVHNHRLHMSVLALLPRNRKEPSDYFFPAAEGELH